MAENYINQYEKSATGNYLLKSRGTLINVIDVAANKTLTQEESGSLIMFDASTDGTIITLPACKAGLNFRIYVSVGAHADAGSQIQTATLGGTTDSVDDYFFGNYQVSQSDTVDQFGVQVVVKATAAAAQEDYDRIILDSNGTGTGGEVGSVIDLYAVDDSGWFVNAMTFTTGTIAETIAGIA
jgi:hypothetical protein